MKVGSILITGSSGLVGSTARKFFIEKGWQVTGVDNNMRHKLFNTPSKSSFRDNDIDIRDEKAVDSIFTHEYDVVLHTAAQPSHDWSWTDPLTDFDINARATLILLEATRKYSPEATFIYVSSDKIYGSSMSRDLGELPTRWNSHFPFSEILALDSTIKTPFGVSKLAGDLYVQEYGFRYGMKTACFRPGCITGKAHEGAEQHGFLAYLTKCITTGKSFKIYGFKGKQVRDQIHAEDIVSAFWHFSQNPGVARTYNMGGGPERSVSILEAIVLIEEATGKKAITEYVSEPRYGDRIWDVHDVAKFRRDYPDWDYKYSLQDIIKDICHTE